MTTKFAANLVQPSSNKLKFFSRQDCCLDELEALQTGKLRNEENDRKIGRVENIISKFKSLCFEVLFVGMLFIIEYHQRDQLFQIRSFTV